MIPNVTYLRLEGRKKKINRGPSNHLPIFLSTLGLTMLCEYLNFQLLAELLLEQHLANFKVVEYGKVFITENHPRVAYLVKVTSIPDEITV